MEIVQELGLQSIPFQGCSILLLQGKDDPEVVKRVLKNTNQKLMKYIHDHYQN